MNKRQKAINKLVRFAIKADDKDELRHPCFTAYRKDWREEVKKNPLKKVLALKNRFRNYCE